MAFSPPLLALPALSPPLPLPDFTEMRLGCASGLLGTRSESTPSRISAINYGPGLGYYGETNFAGGKEIAIGPLAFRWGRWTVLGTLIHELAHSNGAPGGASHAAEEALLHCGLGRLSEKHSGADDRGTPYEPGISG